MRRDDKGRFVADGQPKHRDMYLGEESMPAHANVGLPDGSITCPRCCPEDYAVVAKHRAEVAA